MMNEIQHHRRTPRTAGPEGVGGLLLVLCGLLIVWGPIQLALTAAIALPAVAVRGPWLAGFIVVRMFVAAVGLAAGLMLFARRPAAVGVTRASLVATTIVDVFAYLTPYFPSNRMPGDEWIATSLSVAYAAIWLAYLSRSRRVRNTFE